MADHPFKVGTPVVISQWNQPDRLTEVTAVSGTKRVHVVVQGFVGWLFDEHGHRRGKNDRFTPAPRIRPATEDDVANIRLQTATRALCDYRWGDVSADLREQIARLLGIWPGQKDEVSNG